jgi:hypothetical protein
LLNPDQIGISPPYPPAGGLVIENCKLIIGYLLAPRLIRRIRQLAEKIEETGLISLLVDKLLHTHFYLSGNSDNPN